MEWFDLITFLSMKGYGPYIWSAFGLTLAFLGMEAVFVYKRYKQTFSQRRLK